MTGPDGISSGSPDLARGHRAVVRRELERFLAIRHTGDVLLGGAPGAGGLLLNTKASQEAAFSRAPAAIVPGQEPELHGAGVSRFVEIGSHLAGADAAEGLAGGGPPGVNENGQVGRWDFGKGKARAALSARKCHQRYMAKCQKRLIPGRGGCRRGPCRACGRFR